MIECSYKKIFSDVKKVLFVFSHPDDADIYAGGTIARLVQDGKEVCIVKMTLGNKGSRQENISEKDLAELRLEEDKKAMVLLGIKESHNIYLDLKDGEIEDDSETREKLVKIIRTFKPDMVVTHNPEDKIIRWSDDFNYINHRDHRNTGTVTLDACYPYSRDVLFYPDQLKEDGVSSHIVSTFLFVDYFFHPDTITIDVTETVETRNKAIAAHSSQYSMEAAQESTDFFTKLDNSGRRYERFRYVVAD